MQFNGVAYASSLSDSIKSMTCAKANRGPFLSCFDVYFSGDGKDFGDYKTWDTEFDCDTAANAAKASDQSGYGENAAWFLNGFIFSDTNGYMSSLTGFVCCNIPGTVYGDAAVYTPSSDVLTYVDAVNANYYYGSWTGTIMGVENVKHGVRNGIDYIKYRSIKDYDPQSCSGDGYANCETERIHFVDYYVEHTRDGEVLSIEPEIDTSVFECVDGCDPTITPDCASEYSQDTTQSGGSPNPFVEKFQCKNINFTEAIIDRYHQCRTYPVYPALFYDYSSEEHRLMIVEQLTPYTNAIGECVIRLYYTLFIWAFTKAVIMPAYFNTTEAIASHCCDAVRLVKVVEVQVATKQKHLVVEQDQFME